MPHLMEEIRPKPTDYRKLTASHVGGGFIAGLAQCFVPQFMEMLTSSDTWRAII